MALRVSVSVCLLFNAMAALSEEVALNLTLAIKTQPSNWTVNKTKEGPIALKFSHPCLEHHDSYCINGVCAFHHELKKAICSSRPKEAAKSDEVMPQPAGPAALTNNSWCRPDTGDHKGGTSGKLMNVPLGFILKVSR
ncbi:epigen isoform X3 [Eptesicus fuscus]|uniref:epigen isoform X3 n=1 Tax=Eptesicus fuscus TaxID=29078 RepID=UPI002404740B|nr:epigen isoform X3 [Eptesicus fuscus]